jgi:DNA adenine methylase
MTTVLSETKQAKPFLKWAGGKGQLIDDIDQRLPHDLKAGKIKTYIEPFIGGGAVFFHIAQKFDALEKYVLMDINHDLVSCYNHIKYKVEALIDELKYLEDQYYSTETEERNDLFLKVRKEFNHEKEDTTPKRSAMLIFLNRTCFNGLYRVNRKGDFNVPFGKYSKPAICSEDNLRRVSEILQNAEILCGDFSLCKEYANKHSFVYFDPPYRPISKTASFTSYAKDSFSDKDQARLADLCKGFTKNKVKFLLSNSDPKNEDPEDNFFENHFPESEGFCIDRVKASRAINCKGDKRGQINELIITNY